MKTVAKHIQQKFAFFLFFFLICFCASAQISFNNNNPVLSVCKSTSLSPPLTSINDLISINDPVNGETLTWSVVSGPSHGSLNGFTTSALSNGSTVSPSGLGYKPVRNYSG